MVYFSFYFNLRIVRFVCWTLYNKFWISNYLSDLFLFRMVSNKEMFHHHWFSTLLFNVLLGRSKSTVRDKYSMDQISFGLC
jgi:hypothetical protein